MKKIIVSLILAITALSALPLGRYVCMPTSIIDNKSGAEYKLTRKEMSEIIVVFTLHDGYLVDKTKARFNYIITKSGVDYYENPKESGYILGLGESLNKDKIVGGVLLTKERATIFACKYLGK